jgi:RNA polymerase sigma factor for flagellar operon FliA
MNAHCAIDFDYARDQSAASVFAPGAEHKLLLQYLPLVKRIVNQLSLQANQVLDREDMEQIGLMGLLESLRRYGPPDEQFGGFASLRVRGAILDELRRQDWRPRQVRQQAHKIRDGIRELGRKLGRAPLEEEILAFTGLGSKEYHDFLQADASEEIESLDELLQSGHEHFVESGSGIEDRIVAERLLQQVLAQLSERERLVLTLYYQQELSLKEIALVMDITDARVCQLSKQAIAKASRYLKERS